MDPAIRKKTLRLLSNGMYIMTSRNGEHYGAATITWLSQASFKPPLLMAAVRPDSNVFECLRESRIAAVHILGADQQELAQRFFAPTEARNGTINGEPFAPGKTTAPILRNAHAYLECQVREIIETGGDHTLVLLEVVEVEFRREVKPLTIGESPWEYGG